MGKFDSYIVDFFTVPYKKKSDRPKSPAFNQLLITNYLKKHRGIFYISCPNHKSTDRLVSFLVRRG
jgi:hypothetical protein